MDRRLGARRGAALAAGLIAALAAGAATAAEDAVARGAYLVNGVMGCGNCHTPQGPGGPDPAMHLAGGMTVDEPGLFTAHVPNITQDRETGIGAWTDAQIATAIRGGLRPDGSLIGPPMPGPLYRGISDSDLAAIVAYLRTVPAVRHAVPKSVYAIPLPPAYGPPVVSVAAVPDGDPAAYGAYLAGPLGHCVECHTPMGVGGQADFAGRLGAGGREFHGPWGTSVSSNITPAGAVGLQRRRAEGRDHARGAARWQPHDAADGLWLLCPDDRCRSGCPGRLAAAPAAAGLDRRPPPALGPCARRESATPSRRGAAGSPGGGNARPGRPAPGRCGPTRPRRR